MISFFHERTAPARWTEPRRKECPDWRAVEEVQRLRAEVEKLKQKRVKKTSRNSILPPSTGFKPNQSNAGSTPLNDEGTGSHTKNIPAAC
ncbi:hypothetical protein K9N68_32710 [Kovacikia minuta CCNUW1]|uniref:hypothetical protein n=1 Tax=Kovacikia minuta TaxID=2931930 RepID=UPI001CCC8433|nr:hypothetical protein [Kovacikia minuta]UBF26218.1 hypothetical protein K9N68_32710 [Kovacikia minuta CCNUW1]